MHLARHIGLNLRERLRWVTRTDLKLGISDVGATRDHLNVDRLNNMALLRSDKAVLLVVDFFECLHHHFAIAKVNNQWRVSALIPQMHLADYIGTSRVPTLAFHLKPPINLHFGKCVLQLLYLFIVQRCLDRSLAHNPKISKSHTVSRQHTGKWVDEHTRDAECIGN